MELSVQAVQAWLAGDSERAERLARAALKIQPDDPNALQVLAGVCLRNGRVAEAVEHLRAAQRSAPASPHIANMLGVALRRLGDIEGARRAYARAGALGSAEAWRNLGTLERMENNVDLAIAAFEQALSLQSGDAAAHAGLAQLYEMRHDVARARAHAERALAINPRHEIARIVLAELALRERDWARAEGLLSSLCAEEDAAPVNRAIALGLCGEALDRMGEIDRAFAAFTAANVLLRELHAGALNETVSPFHPDQVRRLTRLVEAEDMRAWRMPEGFDQPAPVFLIGFPRSGTTLLDQILSSHSGIICLEERDILATSVADLLDRDALSRWGALSTELIQHRRRRYWEAAAGALHAPLAGRVLIDKLPLNLVLLPAIARIFPDAKIILALRDPRDVVLSAYQQRFGVNPAMAQMLDLDTAARYYDAVMTLLERCRERLAISIHEVRYEQIVDDLEGVAQALAAFLGVAFEPSMLDFTATARRRDITTPSARQVIQPLYRRSVGRWRAYSTHLAPVLPLLHTWAVRLGYAP